MRFVKTVENLFGLPQGFTRVEHLESSGTQYIDTGFKPNPTTTRFELSYSTTRSTSTFPFGSRVNSSFPSTASCTSYISDTSIRADWAGSNSVAFSTTSGKINNLICENNKMTLNGSDYQGTVEKSSSYLDYNFLLFNMWDGSSGVRATGFAGKFYKAKLWDNGTLVRDYIPCIDPLGVPCMYDLVGKKPYYNQGTGDFTVGRQIIPVEYLEGTGTQYIDTGVRGFADFEIGVKLRESVSNVSIFCGNGYRLERYNASNPYWRFRNNNDFYNSGISITEYHVMAWKNDEVYADGVKLQDFVKTWSVPANMTLFGASASGSYPSMIYFCKLWNPTDGTLLRDFIPCKDENDNGFLFDKLSGGCYLNNGTGNFDFGENKYKTKLRLIKDNVLPTGYTQVEYLESSGTQWIDTGINPENANTQQVDIETNFAVLTPGSDQYIGIFGAAVPRFGFYTRYNNMCFGYAQAHDNVHEIEYGKKYNLRFSVTKGSQNATLDGVTVWSETRTGTLQNIYTIGLFCRNYSTPQWINNARIYNLTIAIDGTLVRNFIPAIDPSGTPCMYDLVSRTPFYNAGTGTFITGKPVLPIVRFIKDIVPREYAIVNYIESTGEQYIDTGFKGNTTTTRYQTKIVPNDVTTTQAVFGSRNVVNLANTSNCEIFIYQSAFRMDWVNGDGSKGLNVPITVNTTYEIEITRGSGFVNGVEYTSTEHTSTTQDYNFLIGNFTNGSSSPYSMGFIGKIYYGKLYNNGMLVRNFIPVVRRVDKIAGMWDTVTKQFFTTPVGAFNFG